MRPRVATVLPSLAPEHIGRIVGRLLRIDPDRLEWTRPLTSYGLDSMNALELVALLEDELGVRLPDWLLLEHPTLSALCDTICGREASVDTELALMTSDSVLPDDIRPSDEATAANDRHHVLLTGATGFLGASLLDTLLQDSEVRVTCLLRGNVETLQQRLQANLQRYGLRRPSFAGRVQVVSGDLSLPRLGLDDATFGALASSIGAVYHAAADVNWVLPYRTLRAANVLGTVELLRFACAGTPKSFAFVSSLSVCYATDGPKVVDEYTEMLPHVARLPLGYAQTKCVSEALVQQAAARGLASRIYRPALLAGNARTGASNLDDLIARLIKGCIQMGSAPDLDWTFDAIPVDYAARAIVRLETRPLPSGSVVHLAHPRPRHWRECVLSTNFFGYRVRLEPFERWRDRLAREASAPDHPLHPLRSFFMRRAEGSRSVAELYETTTRGVALDDGSRAVLHSAGLDCPALNADLLKKFFDDYVSRGFLPAVSRSRVSVGSSSVVERITDALRQQYRDDRLRVRRAQLVQAGSDHSIIGELTRWRRGGSVGLSHYRLELEGRRCPPTLEVMIKSKARDDDVLDIGEMLADVCDPRVARELRHCRDLVGIRASHLRELAVYENPDRRIRRHVPRCFGTWRSNEQASYGLVLERLDGMHLLDASESVDVWDAPCIRAAIDGLASLHAVWFDREHELRAQAWIGHVAGIDTAERLTPLWQALAAHAAPRFANYAGAGLVWTHRHLATHPRRWWPGLMRLPRTLIHNDFNSRNIGIRRTRTGLRLVAYDWELATVGAPQRDLAELLCFVLREDVPHEEVNRWVERHRARLERETGTRLPRDVWRAGFVGALAELLVGRLAFYALIDRVSSQPFLRRVLRTWARLHDVTRRWQDLESPARTHYS